ncbi:MAG: UDP-N-acetylmuramate:L-alanyl-gamma-D-glutamyl-meso-diaminopimelate ligase, partial [Verrucomicrobia bacterium]|nr:UDP-N-acetylmuramate:L-alanyl-gamma-D-glutamyl-meso-diaminopimelate ligase [Verrucomicrobiota bacterium]
LVNVVPSQGTIFVNADDPNSLEVTDQAFTGIQTIGFSKSARYQISDVTLERGMSSFRLINETYRVALIGEFNVRNSAMAVAVALQYNVPVPAIKKALAQFRGVARRQELRGEVNGIKIIDDFGHHPTAIRETITALRYQYPGQKIWAIFEPRSNTTRRAVFQKEIPAALGLADRVILAEIPRLELLPEKDRLDPLGVVATIKAEGVPAFYEPSVAEIIERVRPSAKPGDVIVVFSNGGFDEIHQKLLTELGSHEF